ncbi:Uncharacterized protein PCOAH_00047810 [Plasmodium coatneyi]|uniref:KIR protein n=1 Tax=Plasmodium coatneyi TaxID=208452 RepID=A0A1B1E6J0_9APIC|nr:Uncharacterized protein PCOAH_00047810 [Plasmodium coatneyi]ANQ10654.1 Uncharacterized protein PCOAH_00047810 [Plasmodium coatneyi]
MAEAVLGEEQVKNLRSNALYYSQFQSSSYEMCGDDLIQGVKTALNGHVKLMPHKQEIADAQCAAGISKELSTKNDDDWCYFFYYWLGEKLLGLVGDTEVWTLMNSIYEKWGNMDYGKKCNIVNEDVNDKVTFNQRKLAYEYYFNYGGMKEKLQQYHRKCDKTYYKYLTQTATAYQTVKEECAGKGEGDASDQYCSDFNMKWKEYEERGHDKKEELQILTCDLQSTPQIEESATHDASVGPIVSSVFGIGGGLASIALLLYKYKILPSGIKNFFGSNSRSNRNSYKSRNRRSTNSNFSTFTENDSTAETDYSTSNLTSTGTKSLTEYSIPYTTTTATTSTR